MSYYSMLGTIATNKDFVVHKNAPLIIGGFALLESGRVTEIISIAHIEILTQTGAQLVTIKQSALNTINKKPKNRVKPVNISNRYTKI